jgi:hypothetical protein
VRGRGRLDTVSRHYGLFGRGRFGSVSFLCVRLFGAMTRLIWIKARAGEKDQRSSEQGGRRQCMT